MWKAIVRWSVLLLFAAIFVSVVGWSWIPGLPSYTQRSLSEVRHVHSFASPDLVKALEWLDANASSDAVVAAWWEHGSFINLIAKRATIVDDEQTLYWVHLMARHLMLGQDDPEILEFLASHNATHVLLSAESLSILSIIGYMGSGVQLDRLFALPVFYFDKRAVAGKNLMNYYYTIPNLHLLMHEPLRVNGQTISPGDWRIQGIMLQCEPTETAVIPRHLDAFVILQVRGQTVPIRFRPEKVLWNWTEVELEGQSSPLPVIPCTLLCSGDAARLTQAQIGFLSNTARQSLMIRLFVLGETPSYLEKVYPTVGTSEHTTWRIWKIHYPEGISKNPDWIKTDFPPGPLSDAWLFDKNQPPTRYESGTPDFYLHVASEAIHNTPAAE